MLSNLKIENVAVIEKAAIDFENGLNILTGETGAGKSIVIDSINAILGERTSKDLVRSGAQSAKVTAFFELIGKNVADTLNELDIEQDGDGSLLVSRTITADGRSSCKVNGQPVTVSMLRRLGAELITICGQHDSQKLLQKENHLKYVDSLSGIDSQAAQYRELFHQMQSINRELSRLRKNDGDKQQKLEFLKYQIDELESANIQIGEKEQLDREKKMIRDREKITSNLYGAYNIIAGDENTAGLSDMLYNLSSFLAQLSDYHSSFAEFESSADNLRYELEDCQSALSDEISSLEENEIDIDSIEERLDLLYRMSRKYGATEEDMLEYLEKIKTEYESINTSGERADELEEELSRVKNQVLSLADEISSKRKEFAKQLEARVMHELEYLDMKNCVFKVNFRQTDPHEDGTDEVEFLISANSGQEPKPLSKIASGGELSRIMLALRCVLSAGDGAATMIFDEIDAGVSGRAANKIAFKLREVSRGRQVICVTHLAQIAAGADSHLLIEKHSDSEHTFTQVTKLEDEDRVKEIARIIGGDVVTENTMLSAKELMDFAANS